MPRLALVVPLLGLTACVIGRSAPTTATEAARGPSAVAVTGGPLIPQIAPATPVEDAAAQTRADRVWVQGYWHWDGVRYVWQRGRWESKD